MKTVNKKTVNENTVNKKIMNRKTVNKKTGVTESIAWNNYVTKVGITHNSSDNQNIE
jgi:hypothetical protein